MNNRIDSTSTCMLSNAYMCWGLTPVIIKSPPYDSQEYEFELTSIQVMKHLEIDLNLENGTLSFSI